YLEASLAADPDQLSLRVIYQYINNKYTEMLMHFPYQLSKGELPYKNPEKEPRSLVKLFECYARGFKNKNDIAIAISLVEMAIQFLPTTPSYSLERAF